ncbi:SURF1 family protein [Azospirillum isscasi]|uniref:SURF1-like protein n=1 Tax=Azospirillum isscasi TaxID=3053926 RepID=A0ABU0WAI2_9PROT|nr:SURF1 family protein [Azospirillum isscasi]MDQ2101102.1 SURF1 family protein [Azospirillum isscasi]
MTGPATLRPRRGLVLLGVLALAGVAVLTSLGVWQVERLAWKQDLIRRVEERAQAAPVPAPGPDAWPAVTAASQEYRRVSVTGRFLNDGETLVQAVTGRGGGFWVLTPFRTDQGFTVLVNRGFVPPERRSTDSRAAGLIAEDTTVIGLLRVTEPGGGFLRSNDPAQDRWYSRDVAAIAAARGVTEAAPYFIDAEASPEGGYPVGGLTVLKFPNNHLVYALTWFALDLMLIAAALYVARSEWRRRR